MSFDEENLSINKRRTTKSPLSPTKLSRSKSQIPDLQTTKLEHIFQLNACDENLQSINRQINKSKKVVVLTGAGISCNAGIPDFRSSNGLYNLVKAEHPNVSIGSGKEMFDISLFRDEIKISVWATFMEKLYSSCRLAKPTVTHKFIAHLKERNRLLRCYTQNIDGLEESLGLEMSSSFEENEKENFTLSRWRSFDVVQLHGDLNSLACTQCFQTFPWSRYRSRSFRRGELPNCPRCEEKIFKRSQEGKRLINNCGILRPNIVLYGENHPSGELISHGLNSDIMRGKPDFFIIMGTSLKVDGVKNVVKQISKEVHERGGIVILINKTSVGDSMWHGIIDYQIWQDCDDWVTYLQGELPDFFKSQKEIEKMKKLKREASDLKKKKLEEKRNKEVSSLTTPPTTPIGSGKNDEKIANDSSSDVTSLNKVKRKLIPPKQNKIQKQKKQTKDARCPPKIEEFCSKDEKNLALTEHILVKID
ncbi:hypothetical protein KAFR_0C05870 [Kazachstania africana CBS 2517]|uniref:Deacetylase sirtuin-type domain-containing protein n=1 Tax=Kazachstania africana (strain ATCC 22294 / BCRC 22015 / CBS 2517 / CECT 1963 / NBRC 1671 / NRRL Y-8276) TaxID=1071382 RepID=H2AT78_KAZAF|nr:hypothetical protein KAFR_0C05870 [Kazachstania africana CBS 2517]CCF57578.1 hypothetical protein KAFR_0C05870 [Kazachstania africana CBS 2517]